MSARGKPSRRNGSQRSTGANNRPLPNRNAFTTPPAQQAAPLARPDYPLSIPQEKLAKALELYIRYHEAKESGTFERQIDSQSPLSQLAGYLNVPGSSITHSVKSYAPSQVPESVISFDDEDAAHSPSAKSDGGELMSFDGKRVVTRTRKPLNPIAKAKAALKRHLVSCWVCKSRNVSCPLDHHDMPLLERLRVQRSATSNPRADDGSGSSKLGSEQTATSQSAGLATKPSFSQSQSLMYVGGLGGDMGTILGSMDPRDFEIQSPGAEAYEEITLDTPSRSSAVSDNQAAISRFNPYSSYINGQMLVLGIHRQGLFCCQHQYSDGVCLEVFNTTDELERHFHDAHFQFTRIESPSRILCLACCDFTNHVEAPCVNCYAVGNVDVLIYGTFIRGVIEMQSPSIEWDRDLDFLQQGAVMYAQGLNDAISTGDIELTPTTTTVFSETNATGNPDPIRWAQNGYMAANSNTNEINEIFSHGANFNEYQHSHADTDPYVRSHHSVQGDLSPFNDDQGFRGP